jgi:hypothetical protein
MCSPAAATPAKAYKRCVTGEGSITTKKSFRLEFIRIWVLIFIVRHRPRDLVILGYYYKGRGLSMYLQIQ